MTDKHIVKYNGIGCGYIAMYGIKDIPNGQHKRLAQMLIQGILEGVFALIS